MKTLRAGGASFHEIARKFNDESVPTKKGGKWYASTVQGIVYNKVEEHIIEPDWKITGFKV